MAVIIFITAQPAKSKKRHFANWVQERRKGRGGEATAVGGPPLRLLEAVVEECSAQRPETSSAVGLLLELPGGCRLRVETPVQLAMAAELISLMAQSTRARC